MPEMSPFEVSPVLKRPALETWPAENQRLEAMIAEYRDRPPAHRTLLELEPIVKVLRPLITAICKRLYGQSANQLKHRAIDLEDLEAIVLEKSFILVEQWDGRARFVSYLYGSVRNLLISLIRSPRAEDYAVRYDQPGIIERLATTEASTTHENRQLLERAIEARAVGLREGVILILRFGLGRRYLEQIIAAYQGQPLSSMDERFRGQLMNLLSLPAVHFDKEFTLEAISELFGHVKSWSKKLEADGLRKMQTFLNHNVSV